jgi:hypothetical protein
LHMALGAWTENPTTLHRGLHKHPLTCVFAQYFSHERCWPV